MKRFFVIIFLLSNLIGRSQINATDITCPGDTGVISLDINTPSPLAWEFLDSGSWIPADTTVQGVFYISAFLDTLYTTKCGTYRVWFVGGVSDSIFIPCPLSIGLSIDPNLPGNVLCHGDSSGNREVNPSSGLPPYTFEWFIDGIAFGTSTDTVFYNLPAGPYEVFVSDNNSCKDSVEFNIFQPSPLSVDITKIDPYCDVTNPNGGSNGSIGFSISGGPGGTCGYDYYLIYAGDTIHSDVCSNIFPISSSFSSGYYDLSVTDYNGCQLDTFIILSHQQISVINNSPSNTLCFGDSTGVIDLSVSGGTQPYSYFWGGSPDTTYRDSLHAENYFLQITDDAGCLYEATYTIEQWDEIVPLDYSISPCNATIRGEIDITVVGGNNPYEYSWVASNGGSLGSNPPNAEDLTGLIAGDYTCIIDDDAGCQESVTYTLVDSLQVSISSSEGMSLDCFGGLTILSAVTISNSVTYSWSPLGQTTPQINVGANNYTVTVTDATTLCTATNSLTIDDPGPLQINQDGIDINSISCDGADGTIIINPSGGTQNSLYDYQWSFPNNFNPPPTLNSATDTISSLAPGVYIIFVSDECGNTIDTILQMDDPEFSTLASYDSLTNTIAVEVLIPENSTLGINYNWTNLFTQEILGTSSSITGICEGTYEVIATNTNNNCVTIDTLVVDFGSILDITTTTIYPDSLLWGSGPYDYLWSNGDVTAYAKICPSDPEPYFVEVIDVNGCKKTQDFYIEDLIITLDPASAILECNIENMDIDLTASATGGIGTHSFQWQDGSTDNPINLGLNPGNFSVTVTDYNGCQTDTSFIIAAMTSECVPNVFSPNADGQNDTWNLEDTFLYDDSEVRIYSRFGRLIFESVGYQQPWNGTDKGGGDVSDGVYFYSIDVGHGVDEINGTVTILR